MLFKKKATSKTPNKRSKKMSNVEDKPATKQGTPPPEQKDPLKPIQEREAAAMAPTKAVESGEVKPPTVAQQTAMHTKEPSEMTGPEQMAVTTSGSTQSEEKNAPEKPGQGTPKKQ